MKTLLTFAIVALVIRFYDSDNRLVQSRIFYEDATTEGCQIRKAMVDKQEDPPGNRTETACVDSKDLPPSLVPGDKT